MSTGVSANGSVTGTVSAFSNPTNDPFYKPPVQDHPLVWVLEDVAKNRESDFSKARDPSTLSVKEVVANFARNHERRMAQKMVEQRRKLPPMVNDRALFTRAAPFNDKSDPFYHSPSQRIGNNYSPQSMHAASILFEQFPSDPNAPRSRGIPPQLRDVRSVHSTSRPLSPRLRPLGSPPANSVRTLHSTNGVNGNDILAKPLSQRGNGVVNGNKRDYPDSSLPSDQTSREEVDSQDERPAAKYARLEGSFEDRQQLVDAILRYYYYIELGIDAHKHVAPFREEWAGNALSLVPPQPPPHVDDAFYDALLRSSLEEMASEYVYSMKKAIVDYVILSRIERERLNLERLEPLLAIPPPVEQNRRAVVTRELPPSWRLNVDTAREEIAWTLQTLSVNALELSRMWEQSGFSTLVLTDVSEQGFLEQLPMQADTFRQYQAECTEVVKSMLWTSWAPKSVELFNRLPPVFINGDSDAYFRSVATLQSNQLRSLLQRSLDSYVAFFAKHQPVAEVDPQQDKLLWSVEPAFVLEMVEHEGRPSFKPSFVEYEEVVRNALDNAVTAVSGLPRVGSNLSGASTSFIPPGNERSVGHYANNSSSIPTTTLTEDSVVSARKFVLNIMAGSTEAPRALAAMFDEWMYLLGEEAENFVRTFGERPDEPPSLEEYQAEIDRLRHAAHTIELLCTDDVRTGIYIVRCRAFKEELTTSAKTLENRLLDQLRALNRANNIKINEDYSVMMTEVGKVSHSSEEVLALKRFIQRCAQDQERLKEIIAQNKERDEFMYSHRFPVPAEDFEIAMRAYEWPRKMMDIMKEATTKANAEHKEFELQLKKRRKEFGDVLEKYAVEMEQYHNKNEIMKRDQIATEVSELAEQLKAAAEEAEYINGQEKMFGWALTKYGNVAKMTSTLEPYVTLWTTISQFYDKFAAWMNGPFYKLNPEEVESETNEAFRKLFKSTKYFSGSGGGELRSAPLAVAEEGKHKVQSFLEHLPLINAICNPGLQERHWVALADIVGFEIKRDEVTSLRRLLDHDIASHLQKVSEVSDQASREWSIEKALDKMASDWDGMAFELGPWKETGTFILKGGPVEDAQILLDDHIVKSQAMTSSPFAAPFMDRLGPWEKKLVRFQDIIEQWLKCQSKWLYLEPIFGADEIMKQIPREGQAFRDMDTIWRRIMDRVHANPLMSEVADTPGLLEELQRCNRSLDIVEKVFWTREVSLSIETAGAEGLKAYAGKCTEELNKIVNLVRGQLTSLERATCGSLVVVDVHARDVVSDMAEQGVNDIRDFNWESQMRYYWEFHDAPPSGVHPQETLVVRMINADALYGYEYLGNSSRLVITPLTDRCYRTLMGAIHMNLGGAPAGPAGTGKTETVKDLSKALAIQCVVFNCSDGLDYRAMGKFFKGLACSGAWACFDEFNRIELEVLSVVAQQVLTIIRAKAAHLKAFQFEGVEIRLNPTCNAFITMNPGYAGRSELPDNLKALFRDVAMMVPDYAMIAEIMLYSYGYLEARSMARKLVQTYRLCSEQLSSQDHYDYGMRAVMSVLRAAGNLKRSFPMSAEDVLMLRAINDVNLPKFLDQDVPLFNGILSDLFPGVALPEVDYENIRHAIIEQCKESNLQPLESFITKIIQLYEMIIVRHGLMLVGWSFGMKTCAYRVLAAALTDLNKQGLNDERATKFYVLNPKSVSMGQLYGQEDTVSKEWTDGILAVLFRNAARDTSPDRKWLIFDGPVDAIWIENMNTVLDDNKKLCLNSGEIIAMQGLMNMIFEVQDLAAASPATVSRCGMVYVQPALLGWRPVMLSWLNTLPSPGITATHKAHITHLFDWLIPPMLRVALKQVRSPLPMQDINLVSSCMRLVEAHLDDFQGDLPAAHRDLTEEQQLNWLTCQFLFALVWSLGGNTDDEGRKRFDFCLRHVLSNDPPPELKVWCTGAPVKVATPFPEGKMVYDFVYDKERGKWVPWMDTIESKKISPEAEYSTIIVSTVDTVRYTYLLDRLVQHNMHVLFVGPTGTGKTVYVKKKLQDGLPPHMTSMFINFSAQTSANMTQDIIDGKMDKRKRGLYGPPQGKKMVIFVDDLNMPQVEEYGAQPPIELLRQFMDHSGWYDHKELAFRRLQDVQFVAAMGPPGGGRSAVTNRYLRHYSVVSITSFDSDNLSIIFNTLVDHWMSKYNYPQPISKLTRSLVAASIEVYTLAQRELLPTPTKSHYTFNLRDMSKVFQGITKANEHVADPLQMVRLWTHEVLRVFYDRLVDNDDRLWLGHQLSEIIKLHFKEKPERVFSQDKLDENNTLSALRGLMFGDFMVQGQDKIYTQITDQTAMAAVVNEFLSDFNATSKKPMHLVIFQFALEHVARIARIIQLPGGNALLVGMGGAGRQSLTRLAAYMEEFEVFQIEISKTYGMFEWHEDIKKVLKMAGEANQKVVFLFADTQIVQEGFVEDISNLLNTYEVPNLMQNSDLSTIFENIRPRAKQAGMDGSKEALYNFFVQEVRRNMHIVLSFSPVSSSFRERLRKFPSLVNCTTIDWFTRWPDDALHTVAATFLSHLGSKHDDGKGRYG
ncbi:hypothetical protein DUNSADRAFT_10689 [Dunaliella salina]|uniref:Dynein heavy chain n=1 Tax=Dunaliella salina TaxID=3046 RepID=A0ABQ7GES7_DUNSA|nr:hypothetical protein DUNSADRAFT_10689 [Dunaliella salina]|eukprot:KAF5833108.1 hypothetical protein DUNSADRAFT_10689 [Dunaliella salina]